MVSICSICSGSKGNCTYLEIEGRSFLIDAGGCVSYIEDRLDSLFSKSIFDIEAIFVSHEHLDHINALSIFAFKYKIPVVCNLNTSKAICYHFEKHIPELGIFITDNLFSVGSILVFPFVVHHDSIEPVGFRIMYKDFSLGICTDVGFVSTYLIANLKNCDCLFIESNHDVNMVRSSCRPIVYKQRVLSKFGHLSNADSSKLIKEVYAKKTKTVFLAHISQECNNKELVIESFNSTNTNIKMVLAEQNVPTEIISFN